MEKRPKVIKVIGKVKILMIGFTNEWMKYKTAPTIKQTHQGETLIEGIK